MQLLLRQLHCGFYLFLSFSFIRNRVKTIKLELNLQHTHVETWCWDISFLLHIQFFVCFIKDLELINIMANADDFLSSKIHIFYIKISVFLFLYKCDCCCCSCCCCWCECFCRMSFAAAVLDETVVVMLANHFSLA